MSETLLVLLLVGAIPFVLLATTSFAKLSIVLGMLRSALGAGQLPSSSIVVVLAGILTGYVMLPVARSVLEVSAAPLAQLDSRAPFAAESGKALRAAFDLGKEPVRGFLARNAGAAERRMFLELLRQRLPEDLRAGVSDSDFGVVLPAFFVTELKEALELGFLLLLPFLVVDLVVASLLTSLGMSALPPSGVALPFKLLLFVTVDGFRTLAETLVSGYR